MGSYRRRCILLPEVAVVSAYRLLCSEIKVGGLSVVLVSLSCLICGGKLASNGRYKRSWVDTDLLVVQLTIFRARCCTRHCRVAWTLLPGLVLVHFRYSPRLVQWACWRMLAGVGAGAICKALHERASALGRQQRGVPAEPTVRAWLRWLGRSELQGLVRLTLSFIARVVPDRSPEALWLVVDPANRSSWCRRGNQGVRERAGRVLRACMALHAALQKKVVRRTPEQVRDWARWLFCEHRLVLCRSA